MVAVRLSGLLLTLMTLTFALFADEFLFQYSWSGGGLSGVNIPRPLVGSLNFTSDRSFLVLAFVVLAATMGLVVLVQRGTTGRYLAAIRGSQTAAESLGISLTRARLQVFALSAGLAGLGGALYGSLYHSVTATTFPYEYLARVRGGGHHHRGEHGGGSGAGGYGLRHFQHLAHVPAGPLRRDRARSCSPWVR